MCPSHRSDGDIIIGYDYHHDFGCAYECAYGCTGASRSLTQLTVCPGESGHCDVIIMNEYGYEYDSTYGDGEREYRGLDVLGTTDDVSVARK